MHGYEHTRSLWGQFIYVNLVLLVFLIVAVSWLFFYGVDVFHSFDTAWLLYWSCNRWIRTVVFVVYMLNFGLMNVNYCVYSNLWKFIMDKHCLIYWRLASSCESTFFCLSGMNDLLFLLFQIGKNGKCVKIHVSNDQKLPILIKISSKSQFNFNYC